MYILLIQFNCISGCSSIAISHDDSYIITGHNDGSIKIWSNNEKPEKVIDIHEERVNHIEVIKNENQILTISKDHTIKLYDIRKLEEIYSIGDNYLNHYCESNLTISSDKKYFACGSSKGEIYVFNLLTGKREEVIDNKSTASILAIQWRPYHSQIYVGDSNGSLSVWGSS
jgi:WD40 repeat protein